VEHMFARVKVTGQPPSQAFVFLAARRPPNMKSDEYRAGRASMLAVYCHAVKSSIPSVRESIGLASEPFSTDMASQDFLFVDLTTMTDDELRRWRSDADTLGVFRPESEARLVSGMEAEFPIP